LIRSGARLGLMLVSIGLAAPPATSPADEIAPPAPAAETSAALQASLARLATHIRTRGDRFEIVSGGVARPITIRGVNLGAGAPGHFPGEFAFTRDDYRRYLRFARELHANAIRVYTLHPPAFYEALREENEANPERPLWLFQGVWTELPSSNDFWDEAFTEGFDRDVECAVDAIHGNVEITPRPGHAAGRYAADVSPWLGGWVLGREWEPYAVRETERRHPDSTSFAGPWFTVARGTAMEVWLARACDRLVDRERSRYASAHAVSFVNWPTLDVMRHPTESEPGGVEAHHDEDAHAVDPTRIRPTRQAELAAGFLGYFASYHVYPYYPDFLNLEPGYAAHRDRHGACNYAGYLADLRAHTPDLPLLIAEYGIPTSRGIAHVQPQGLHHGGASDAEQGRQIARLLEDIEDAGCAGSLLFALFDEWFKVNWLVWKNERPRDRDPLWHNLMDAEEGYGLIAFDPPSRIRVDGDVADWRGIAPYARAPGARAAAARSARAPAGADRMEQRPAPMLRALYVTSDDARLYLRLDADPAALRGRAKAFGVALDVLDPRRGAPRLPAPLDASWSRGAEYVLIVDPGRHPGGREPWAELFIDRRMGWSEFGRVREGAALVPCAPPMRTEAHDDGLYVPLMVNVNRDRVGADGTVYPGHDLDWGRLALGRERTRRGAAPGSAVRSVDPRAEWWIDRKRGVIEIALPWGLINVGDPSSRAVLDDLPGTDDVECTTTGGIGLLAWATRAAGFRADSLGPTRDGAHRAMPGETQFLGPDGTRQLTMGQHVQIVTPEGISYLWNGWERPITQERAKASAEVVRKAFDEMESRESRTYREFNALEHSSPTRTRPRVRSRSNHHRRRSPGRRGRRPGRHAGLRGHR
jgi:hypothetical protein